MEEVILVDTKDNVIGTMEKNEVHRKGLLHRAFSILIFNEKGELLLQKRAIHKYHSGGLWTNTCCSHPRPGESTDAAAQRRLEEEMGMKVELYNLYNFIYQYKFNDELSEHELDHVYLGKSGRNPVINPEEVAEFKWITWTELVKDIKVNPEDYTFWFKQMITKLDSERTLLERFNLFIS